MKRFAFAMLLAAFAAASLPAQQRAQSRRPEAPDFTLPDTTNKPVHLSDFLGKKNVVLAFFPAAFTGG
jgi:cytochrome oxidase Cu insertion factor (SCO1/SenC/PrrC family)